MGNLRSLASQTAIYGVSTILGRTIGFVLFPVLTWALTKEGLGIIGELYSYMAFLNVLAAFGMETAYFHFANKIEEQKAYNQGFIFISMMGLLLALIIFLAAPFLNEILHTSNPNYYRLAAGFLFFDTLAILPFARLRFQNKAKKFALLKLGNIIANVGLNLFFLFALPALLDRNYTFLEFMKIEDKVLYFFIANMMASALVFIVLLPSILRVKLAWNAMFISKMLKYSWPLVVVGLAAMINETLDKPLLRWLLPLDITQAREQVGIYTSVYKISIIMAVVVQAFKFAAEPFFFSIQKEGNARATYALILKWFIVFQCIVFLVVSVNLDTILLIISPEYRVGKSVVPIVLLAQMFLGIYYNLSIWYKVTERTIWGSVMSLAGAILTISLNWALVPTLGYIGAAWATLSCYGGMTILSVFIGRKYYPVPYQWLRILFYLSLTLTSYLVADHYFSNLGTFSHFILSIVWVLAFVILVWLIEKPKKTILLPS